MATFLTDANTPPEGSDAAFWGDDMGESFDLEGALKEAVTQISKKEVRLKRGNIKGLGKHLAKKYGPSSGRPPPTLPGRPL